MDSLKSFFIIWLACLAWGIVVMVVVLPLVRKYWRRRYTRPIEESNEGGVGTSGAEQFRQMERDFDRAQDSALYRHLGIAPLPDAYRIDPESYERLSSRTELDESVRFYACTRLAHDADRGSDYERAARYLRQALAIRPGDAVPNARLAIAYERMGEGEQAIRHYEVAAVSPSNMTGLGDYFRSEAERVRTERPQEWHWRPIY